MFPFLWLGSILLTVDICGSIEKNKINQNMEKQDWVVDNVVLKILIALKRRDGDYGYVVINNFPRASM